MDSETNEQYVLIRAAVYEQMGEKVDYSPWTPEKLDRLHEDAGAMLDHFGK